MTKKRGKLVEDARFQSEFELPGGLTDVVGLLAAISEEHGVDSFVELSMLLGFFTIS